MEQLKMRRDASPVTLFKPPAGYYIRTYESGDAENWCRCCAEGELGVDEISDEFFNKVMSPEKGVDLKNIYFIVSPDGEAAGTATYQYREKPFEANLHMVAVKKDFRGLGLSAPLVSHAAAQMICNGVREIFLTTDDFRVPAIKTYLKCGFVPVIDLEGAAERWDKIFGINNPARK